jgi:hypothetical protein
MERRQDALEFLAEMDAWSTVDMQRTVAKMMRGAERIMERIVESASVQECDARRIKDLSTALKSVADSVERYTGIYAWCMQQGQVGSHTTALEDLLPLLNNVETRELHGWMQRLEVYGQRR